MRSDPVVNRAHFDELRGEEGNDVIYGGGGRDRIGGGKGDDEVHGGLGNDRITGGKGVDTLYGDNGNDTLCDNDEAGGPHFMDGGNGNDKLWLDDPDGTGNGFSSGSTCGPGTDQWGDADDWASGPSLCGPSINSPPGTCP